MASETESKGIYHWKLGDIALARMCKKVYARVRVIKDEKGLFYDDKVLGITGNDEGLNITKELCYYVETCRTNQRFWLPYTCMHLAGRSRPFYGSEKPTTTKVKTEGTERKTSIVPRKRKPKEEHVVPLEVKISKVPDLNTTYDLLHMPLKQGKYENAFKEFVRRGKEVMFDTYFNTMIANPDEHKDSLDYLLNVDASTEDKIEMVLKNVVSEKEIENYLHQCWRYNFVHKQSEKRDSGKVLGENSNSSKDAITVHTTWCLVCGKTDKLRACLNCPSSFHLPCRREWLMSILHRKNPPKKAPKPVTLVEKILSSTRTKCTVRKEKENMDLCPSCMWGPRVGYDDVVWHKLRGCAWWPARVLAPGDAPACLLTRAHHRDHWPLRYYGTLNHSWAEIQRISLFLPSHTAALNARDPTLRQAVLDACDDYISIYLT